MPARCEANNRIVAHTASGFVRRMSDAGNRDTHSVKNVEHQKTTVGAWCRIGGGQGALSHAHKETGVACRPSKQPDYSGLSERKQCSEAHITAPDL